MAPYRLRNDVGKGDLNKSVGRAWTMNIDGKRALPCLAAGCTETNVEEGQILSGCGSDEKMVLTPHLQTHIPWRRLSQVPFCPAKNLDE